MKKIIFSLVSLAGVLMLIAMALPAINPPPVVASPGVKYEGWDKSQSKWANGNMAGYAEGDCIPSYLEVTNKEASAQNVTVRLIFDYRDISTDRLAFLGYECCNCSSCPSSAPLSCCAGGSDITSCPVRGNITGPDYYDTKAGIEYYAYTWNFTIAGGETITQCWCGRLSNECALFPGAKMHMTVDISGGGTLSVNPGALAVPDLYATKNATVTCDAIDYTISYGKDQGDSDKCHGRRKQRRHHHVEYRESGCWGYGQ